MSTRRPAAPALSLLAALPCQVLATSLLRQTTSGASRHSCPLFSSCWAVGRIEPSPTDGKSHRSNNQTYQSNFFYSISSRGFALAR
ncbi:hypothetical protein N656DRAFT_540723 [Canariomyces notabilis]|uniref:Secreted protein n=1 Tax=Canariomyces notabilis TaxID=2074819 RepID=A0AAN6TIA9_9PEZI|nr:hypothetical protein N656DRAFT_540723 [Canariomyces arenarius]